MSFSFPKPEHVQRTGSPTLSQHAREGQHNQRGVHRHRAGSKTNMLIPIKINGLTSSLIMTTGSTCVRIKCITRDSLGSLYNAVQRCLFMHDLMQLQLWHEL